MIFLILSKRSRWFGVVVASLCLAFAVSEVSAQGVTIKGDLDCGQWLEARADRDVEPTALRNYVQGLVNGLALGRGIEIWKHHGQDTSPEQLFFYLDKYCQDNPLNEVVSGVFAFADKKTDGEFSRMVRERR